MATPAPDTPVDSCQVAGPVPDDIPVRSRWLLAEAWWAEKFLPPTYADIVSWSFRDLPVAVLAHFDRRFRRVQFASARSLLILHPLINYLRALGLLLLEGVVLLLGLALTPITLLAIALLNLLGLIPIAATRELAGALQQGLAATIGDSYVFMRQPIIAATIYSSVKNTARARAFFASPLFRPT